MSRAWIVAGWVVLAAGVARGQSDVEVELSGSMRVRGFYVGNDTRVADPDLLDPVTRANLNLDEDVDATQHFLDARLRLGLAVTAYQEVTTFLGVEVGDITFGDDVSGGQLGTDGRVFENKNLYLEWHPVRYSFKLRGGLYPLESDPLGLVLSDDVAGVHGEVELQGLDTQLYLDMIKAVEESRTDLDGDGDIDNDFNDRTLFIGGVRTQAIPYVDLETYFITDIDDTQDTPVGNTERDTYWGGVTLRSALGPASLSSTFLYGYGQQTTTGTPGVTIRGWASDTRLELALPFVNLQFTYGYATGRDPDRLTTDTAFPTISPFYGVSGIIYGNFGGLNVTGSNLTGTTHATLKVRVTPLEGFDIEAVAQYAWYTADRDVSGHQIRFKRGARDLGFEADLNVGYQILSNFRVQARGSIFFPGEGFYVERDTRRRGTLAQMILVAQMNF